MTPNVLFLDNHLLVAEKPPMMPVQEDASGDVDFLNLLKQYIKEKYQKPGAVFLGLVHRLDRPAGGVMVFARTSKAASRLAQQMQRGEIEKYYYALLTGNPKEAGTLEDYLVKDSKRNMVRIGKREEPGAKYAKLEYRILARRQGQALAEIHLLTGRSHQIRVQFASRGCALVGDMRYGKGEGPHLALFSHRLDFLHPVKKEPLSFCLAPGDPVFQKFREDFLENQKRTKC